MSLLYVTYLPGAFLDSSTIKKTKLVRPQNLLVSLFAQIGLSSCSHLNKQAHSSSHLNWLLISCLEESHRLLH